MASTDQAKMARQAKAGQLVTAQASGLLDRARRRAALLSTLLLLVLLFCVASLPSQAGSFRVSQPPSYGFVYGKFSPKPYHRTVRLVGSVDSRARRDGAAWSNKRSVSAFRRDVRSTRGRRIGAYRTENLDSARRLVPGLWAATIYGVDWQTLDKPILPRIVIGFAHNPVQRKSRLDPSAPLWGQLPREERLAVLSHPVNDRLSVDALMAEYGSAGSGEGGHAFGAQSVDSRVIGGNLNLALLDSGDSPVTLDAGVGLSVSQSRSGDYDAASLDLFSRPVAPPDRIEIEGRVNAILRAGITGRVARDTRVRSYFVVAYSQYLPLGLDIASNRKHRETRRSGQRLAVGAGFDMLSSAWLRANIQASYLVLNGRAASGTSLGGTVRVRF